MIEHRDSDEWLEQEIADLSEALFEGEHPVPEYLIQRVLGAIQESEQPSPDRVSWVATLPIAGLIVVLLVLANTPMLTAPAIVGLITVAIVYGGTVRLLLNEGVL